MDNISRLASPQMLSQNQVADIQAARARRRLQNKNAQRQHRLRKATQRALLSQGQDSQPETSMNFQSEPEPGWSSPFTPVDALPTPLFSQHDPFTTHNFDVGLTNSINLDSLSLEDFLSRIEGPEKADVSFLEGQASDIITTGTPSLIIHSGDSSGTSPSPLSFPFPGSRQQNTIPQGQKQTNSGQRAIHTASQRGFVSIIQVLLENGADPNLIDSHGRTALHHAVEANHIESIKVLLQWGANPLATDLSGLDSLHTAVTKGHHSVVCLLMDHGVDPNLGALSEISSVQVVRVNP